MSADSTFNPAYRIAMCGQQSSHGPHVTEHGPDQPRNCPGTGRRTVNVRTDGDFDPCIGGGSSRDCERGECNARAVCVAAALGFSEVTP
jgi:hypothetical protein